MIPADILRAVRAKHPAFVTVDDLRIAAHGWYVIAYIPLLITPLTVGKWFEDAGADVLGLHSDIDAKTGAITRQTVTFRVTAYRKVK